MGYDLQSKHDYFSATNGNWDYLTRPPWRSVGSRPVRSTRSTTRTAANPMKPVRPGVAVTSPTTIQRVTDNDARELAAALRRAIAAAEGKS